MKRSELIEIIEQRLPDNCILSNADSEKNIYIKRYSTLHKKHMAFVKIYQKENKSWCLSFYDSSLKDNNLELPDKQIGDFFEIFLEKYNSYLNLISDMNKVHYDIFSLSDPNVLKKLIRENNLKKLKI
jgi:hypothetical protein